MPNIIVFGIANQKYLDMLKKLFSSVKKHNQDITCHGHLVNITDITDPKDCNADELSFSKFVMNEKIQSKVKNRDFRGEAGYCVNVRTKLAFDLLSNAEDNDIFIYLDADSIVRKNLSPLIELASKSNILCFTNKKRQRKLHKYLCSTIVFRNNPLVRKFCDIWYHKIFDFGMQCYWDEDQITFSQLSEKKGFEIVTPLPLKYVDFEFHSGSPIWCGKGQRKNYPIFINESNNHCNVKSSNKIGILSYSTNNIGDDIQSVAMINFLKLYDIQIDYYVDRDNFSIIYDRDFNLLNQPPISEKIILIVNCWFTRGLKHFPFPANINPIFVDLHIPQNYEDKFNLVKSNVEYWRKFQPVGARDSHTKSLFEKYGIESVLVGCPTLTLDKNLYLDENFPRNTLIVGDLNKVNLVGTKFDTRNKKYISFSVKERFDEATKMLKLFCNAEKIYTNRLHCYLPSFAFGTDVELVEIPEKNRMIDYKTKILEIKENINHLIKYQLRDLLDN